MVKCLIMVYIVEEENLYCSYVEYILIGLFGDILKYYLFLFFVGFIN